MTTPLLNNMEVLTFFVLMVILWSAALVCLCVLSFQGIYLTELPASLFILWGGCSAFGTVLALGRGIPLRGIAK
jgi:hypothetical protein